MQWTRHELDRAFSKLHPPGDWKGPIDATVDHADLAISLEAVEFFTATACQVMPAERDKVRRVSRFRITSPGYRMGPAGP